MWNAPDDVNVGRVQERRIPLIGDGRLDKETDYSSRATQVWLCHPHENHPFIATPNPPTAPAADRETPKMENAPETHSPGA